MLSVGNMGLVEDKLKRKFVSELLDLRESAFAFNCIHNKNCYLNDRRFYYSTNPWDKQFLFHDEIAANIMFVNIWERMWEKIEPLGVVSFNDFSTEVLKNPHKTTIAHFQH